MYHLFSHQIQAEHPAFDILFDKMSAYDALTTPKYLTPVTSSPFTPLTPRYKSAVALRQERPTATPGHYNLRHSPNSTSHCQAMSE